MWMHVYVVDVISICTECVYNVQVFFFQFWYYNDMRIARYSFLIKKNYFGFAEMTER